MCRYRRGITQKSCQIAVGKLKKIGIILGYTLLFAAIVAIVVYAHIEADNHRVSQPVTSFDIHIDGSGDHILVDVESMYRWFTEHGVNPQDKSIAEVDLAALEQVALKHSAIASTNAYVTYNGRVDMQIIQREPIARFRVNGGYDHYISKDGVMFRATDGYAAYVPIITGNYQPIVDRTFTGNLNQYIEDSIASINRRIEALEQAKYPIYTDRKQIKERNRQVQDSVLKKPIWISAEKHEQRKADLALFKEAHNRKYKSQDAELEKRLNRLDAEQERLRDDIAALRESSVDLRRFVEFIEKLSNDEFWRNEITQIVVSTSFSGNMLVEIVPRSGDFIIDLGDTHSIDTKLHNVRTFYDKVLRSVGWEAYSRISVRYDGQVVCQPRKEIKSEKDKN